jgi:diguanylate cyclase (GGDEF)-like protein
MRGTRAAAVDALAALFLVSGCLALLGAARPLTERTPVGMLVGLGLGGLLGGALLLTVRRRSWTWPLHLGVLTVSLCVGALAQASVTVQGVVGLGPLLICLGLYTAHFCPIRVARAHTAFALVTGTAGAIASEPTFPAQQWLIVLVAAVVVTEVQGRLTSALRHAAMHDPLTGLLNRRAWLEAAARDLRTAQRRGRGPLAVVLIDLDEFKAVNDEHGHAGGDRLLQELAVAWEGVLRGSDLLARYGGDEFALLLALDARAVDAVLDRMRAAHPASWTPGVAMWQPGDTLDGLLLRSDEVLYARKLAGRG